MSFETFIPTLWASEIQKSYDRALVYGSPRVVNRRYEGVIRQRGDTVKIKSVNDPTIQTHVRGQDIAAPERANGAEILLRITEEKYFNITIPDIDRVQSDPEYFEEFTRRAGFKFGDTTDTFIASELSTNVPSANLVGTDASPKVPTAATAYEFLVDLGVILDENDVPPEGRFCVITPWYEGLLRKDDRFVSFGTDANRSVIRGEPIGDVNGLTILKSNNVPNTSGAKYKIIAGHTDACTFAEQMLGSLEPYRPEKRFEDAVKQLKAYGARTTRPYALAMLTADKS